MAYGLMVFFPRAFGQEGCSSPTCIRPFRPSRFPIVEAHPGHRAARQRAHHPRLSRPSCRCLSPSSSTARAGASGSASSARPRMRRQTAGVTSEPASVPDDAPGRASSAASAEPDPPLGDVLLFAKQMTNERGLIALAAIFFAKGNPPPAPWRSPSFSARRRRSRRRLPLNHGGGAAAPPAHTLRRDGAGAGRGRHSQRAPAQPPWRLALRALIRPWCVA